MGDIVTTEETIQAALYDTFACRLDVDGWVYAKALFWKCFYENQLKMSASGKALSEEVSCGGI